MNIIKKLCFFFFALSSRKFSTYSNLNVIIKNFTDEVDDIKIKSIGRLKEAKLEIEKAVAEYQPSTSISYKNFRVS